MRNLRLPAFLLALTLSGVPALFAKTTVVHQMGVAPLFGTVPSTPELRADFAAHPERVREAARKIGLSQKEYRAFIHKFNTEKPYWGEVPRHLDAMSWAADGEVHALHDVEIPAGINGWEVDLRERHQVVAIYIPMICGNLSVVRRPIHEVAALPPPPLPPPPVHEVAPPPAPAPVPLVAAQTPPPAMDIPPVAPAAVHHPHLLLPILALAAAAVLIASNHHHGGSSSPSSPPGTVTPPVVVPPVVVPPVVGPPVPVLPTFPPNGYHCLCNT